MRLVNCKKLCFVLITLSLLACDTNDPSTLPTSDASASADAMRAPVVVDLPQQATLASHIIEISAPKSLAGLQEAFVTPMVDKGHVVILFYATELDGDSPSVKVGSAKFVDNQTKAEATWVPDESPWKYTTNMKCSKTAGVLACEEPTGSSFTLQLRAGGDASDGTIMPLLIQNLTLSQIVFTKDAESMTGTLTGILPYEVTSKVFVDFNGDGKIEPRADPSLVQFLGKPNADSDGDGVNDDFIFTANFEAKRAVLM